MVSFDVATLREVKNVLRYCIGEITSKICNEMAMKNQRQKDIGNALGEQFMPILRKYKFMQYFI